MTEPSPVASAPVADLALPPPPPLIDPRPTPAQRAVLLALFGAGAALVVAALLLPGDWTLPVQRGGFFLATYAALVATAWLPASVLTRRVDALVERWVRNSSGGFYGVMALSVFLQLELVSAVRRFAGFEPSGQWLREAAMQRLTGFGQDSIMNFVWGMAWPGRLLKDHGPHATAALAVLAWLVFLAARRVLPHATFARRGKDGKSSS